MNYYINIQLKPDAEMQENVLLNKVYTKFHKGLSILKTSGIGVSFPQYRITLGRVIRIHGTENNLLKLQDTHWLGGLSAYCELSNIQEVPSDVRHRVVARIQSNMTASKLRRLITRGTINAEQTNQYKAKMFSQGLDNPYLELESSSNGNKHRRYIQFGELLDEPITGEFDQFGLSKTATIPWFSFK